ncbi:MAG: murein hydrolase activator EnvC [Actinomycetota bacterium]
MQARHRTLRTASLALISIAALMLATPGSADTKGQLDAARSRLETVQAELDRATARYSDAYDRYVRTSGEIQQTRLDIQQTRARMDRLGRALSKRARSVYETGVSGAIDTLLSADSISELSDRIEFLGAVQQSNTDLVTEADVTTERLRRQQHDLSVLAAGQRDTANALQHEQQGIQASLDEASALVDQLTQQLRAEERTQAALALVGIRTISGGALVTCPVAGPHSYVDSFGAPRSGGRTHEGDDIMAPRGTPVVAAQTGNAVQTPNDLGGNAMIVYADNGDYTYYAHLDSYGASGHVGAGTLIGTVGNTGNAAGGPTHLHFEYHPGGGSAIDPTPYLDAVC